MRLLLVVLLVLVVVRSAVVVWQRRRCCPTHRRAQGRVARVSPPWRPRSPADCTLCRAQTTRPVQPAVAPTVQPWRERKSRRGAPKRVATAGYACPSPACLYYGITDDQVHA